MQPAPPPDGGSGVSACALDGGCTSPTCPDVAGQYYGRITCPSPLQGGCDTMEIVRTCDCRFSGWIGANGGFGCADMCLDSAGAVTSRFVFQGFPIPCTGQFADGGAHLTCDLGTFGMCEVDLGAGSSGPTCP